MKTLLVHYKESLLISGLLFALLSDRTQAELSGSDSATMLGLQTQFMVTEAFTIPANETYVVLYNKQSFTPVEFHAELPKILSQGPALVCAVFANKSNEARTFTRDTPLSLRDSQQDFPKYKATIPVWGSQDSWSEQREWVAQYYDDMNPRSRTYCQKLVRNVPVTKWVNHPQPAVVGQEDVFEQVSTEMQALSDKGVERLKFILGIENLNVRVRCGYVMRKQDKAPTIEESAVTVAQFRELLSPYIAFHEQPALDLFRGVPIEPSKLSAQNMVK